MHQVVGRALVRRETLHRVAELKVLYAQAGNVLKRSTEIALELLESLIAFCHLPTVRREGQEPCQQ